ncbi:MAG: PTS system mannose/fructose/N-acetylgalactosamine-transporter subunit IIB [Paenibacillaceae bacterium]|nr:PTS system mannose/fructose/N-acetylgalactosamine-transporter subunit IIB [Paenibacillaceae bacterium]
MAVPNIVSFRIDERLIHGQGQLWIKALGVNTVIVANDSASEDTMQQTLMKTVVPKSVAMRFFSIQHTCDVIMKASPRQTIFIVCKTPEDARMLVAGGIPVQEINVGNIHHGPGKEEVSKYISLGQEDKEALREMRDKYGIRFNTKTTASGDDGAIKVDLNKYL